MRYRATLAYDGTAYRGFQRQADGLPTIQLAVERAITAVTGQMAIVTGAGRTDTGVHATGQVIAFETDWKHDERTLLRALNVSLPPDIALQDIRQHEGFHPRFDALARLYRYRLWQAAERQPLLWNRAWHVRDKLDGGQMQAAADMLIGEHNFGAFGRPPRGENTVRTVFHSQWEQQPQPSGVLWTYTIEANAFLQHMVRHTVWTLVKVGQGKMALANFEAMFRRAQLAAIGLAPPQGLTLEAVRYPE